MKPAFVDFFASISRPAAYPAASMLWLGLSEERKIFGVCSTFSDEGTYQAVFAQTASSDAPMASDRSAAPSATRSTFCRQSARAAFRASVAATLPRLITVHPLAVAKASAEVTKLS